MVYGKEEQDEESKDSLLLKDLVTIYLESNSRSKLKTRTMYQTALNSFTEYREGVSVLDVTPDFLIDFERSKRGSDYSPATISCYMRHWQQQKLNKYLKQISEKLELSVDLRLKTSRDSYATTLKRSGKSRDEIGEMMGHSTAQVTDHYLASLDMDKTWGINSGLL